MRLAKLVLPALAFGLIITNTPCGRADEKPQQPKALLLMEISTDARADDEFGHTVYGYTLFDDGKAVSARYVYNWAVQNSRSKKLDPEQVKEVMRLVKGLPKKKGDAIPRQFLVRVWFAGQGEADRLEFDHRKLPADLKTVLELFRVRPEKYVVEDPQGDPLPPGALNQMGTFRLRYQSDVNCLAFAPDGTALASGHRDGTIHLWDVPSGKLRATLKGHRSAVFELTLAPDGKTLLSQSFAHGGDFIVGDHTLRLWNLATGKEIAQWEYWGGPCVFSSDGKLLALAHEREAVSLWNTATGKEIRTLKARKHVTSLAFSPDSKMLAVIEYDDHVRKRKKQDAAAPKAETVNHLTLWEVSTAAVRSRLEAVPSWAIFSSNGKRIALWDEATVLLWEPLTGKELCRHSDPKRVLSAVAFAADGRLRVLDHGQGERGDRDIRVWQPETGKELARAELQNSPARIRLSPDGRRLAAALWGQHELQAIYLWDLAGDAKRLTIDRGATVLTYSADGNTLASAMPFDGAISLWNAATGNELSPPGHRNPVRRVVVSPDGKLLATTAPTAAHDDGLRLWDAASGKHLRYFPHMWASVEGAAFSHDSKLLAASRGNDLHVWDAASGRRLAKFEERFLAFGPVAFSPDNQRVITCETFNSPFGLSRWDYRKGEFKLVPGPFQNGSGRTFAHAPEGQPAAIVNREWGEAAIVNDKGIIKYVDRQPDKAQKNLVVRELGAGRLLGTIEKLPTAERPNVAVSRDGKHLAAGGKDGTVWAWELPAGKICFQKNAHEKSKLACAVAISPDGKLVASGGADKAIRLWHAADGKEAGTLRGHRGAVTSLAFFPDGKSLASSSEDGTVLVWDLTKAER